MSNKADREYLLRILSMCLDVEHKGADPFEVDVQEILITLRKYLPGWETLEDFILDVQALNSIASVVGLQGNWIKNRSTSLYLDPLLIELKIKTINIERLVDLFVKAWTPLIEFERLSQKRVNEAVDYWNQLLSFDQRKLNFPAPLNNLGSTNVDELFKQRLISDKSFTEQLQNLWEELKETTRPRDQISYWVFITADTFEETIYRAYMTSFLVTYGYASMTVNPIEEEVFLIPYDERRDFNQKTQSVSIPIAIDYETWKNMRGKKLE
ncbi:MAG: hypothetical protein V1915_02900 [Candidatus Bathyarchaeota archaeon]